MARSYRSLNNRFFFSFFFFCEKHVYSTKGTSGNKRRTEKGANIHHSYLGRGGKGYRRLAIFPPSWGVKRKGLTIAITVSSSTYSCEKVNVQQQSRKDFLKFSFFHYWAVKRRIIVRSGFAPVASRFLFYWQERGRKITRNVFWFRDV